MNTNSPTAITQEQVTKLLQTRPADGHKGTFGHALLIAGSQGMMGAALLAARAAMRSGVGKTSVACPHGQSAILQIGLPEAILVLDESPSGTWSAPIELHGFQSLVMGPGIGTSGETQWAFKTQLQMLLARQLEGDTLPLLLDADALNLLANDYQLLTMLPKGCIITPHLGEMQRLCRALELPSDTPKALAESSAIIACELEIFVVLKSHQTQIFAPDVLHFINRDQGNSGMATAGSGDVLAGLIGGLLAQGYTPLDAAQLGVYLHATAGDAAAKVMGEHSLLASDLIDALPQAFRTLQNDQRS